MKTLLVGLALFFTAPLSVKNDHQIEIVYASGDQVGTSTQVEEGCPLPTPPAKGEWIIGDDSFGDVATIFAVSIQDTSNPAAAINANAVWRVVITPPNGADPVTAYFRQQDKPVVPTKGWWKPGLVYTRIERNKGGKLKWTLFDRKIVAVNMANAFAIQIDWVK